MIWLAIPALAAAAYYLLALIAGLQFRGVRPATGPTPPVSILKPMHGRDPRLYEALVSHARQKYPEFEILFGFNQPNDPGLQDVLRLQSEFPALPITVHQINVSTPNPKAGVLAELARHAKHPVILVNDSDIAVDPGYLRQVTAPLADPKVGLITCLYRARGDSWAARLEALGIATEFAPSVLVARLLGVVEFALGSTMCFRAETLEKIGGFQAIAEYLADDYQLGRSVHSLGYRIELAPMVVETGLGAGSLAGVWRHQLRWSRTIRVSRPGGYLGYVVTHATLWALVAAAAQQWWAAGIAMGLRLMAGAFIGAVVLGDRRALTRFWLMPFRDLFGFAVWLAGAFGREVEWRDSRFRLDPDGRIRRIPLRS